MQTKQAVDDKELDLIILEAIESVLAGADLASESETRYSLSTTHQ